MNINKNQKKMPPIINRLPPLINNLPFFSNLPIPVLETYVESSNKKSNGEFIRMMGQKSRIFEPQKSEISIIKIKNTNYPINQKINPPNEDINNLNIPDFKAKYSKSISSKDKKKILDFLKGISDNSTITLPSGTYSENININKSICIESKGNVIINPSIKKPVLTINSGNSTFKNLTFQQKSTESIPCILIENGIVLFENCIFNSDLSDIFLIKNDSIVYLRNCNISSKTIALNLNNNSILHAFQTTFSNSESILLLNNSKSHFQSCIFNNFSKDCIIAKDESIFHIDTSQINGCSLNGLYISTTKTLSLIIQTSIEGCNKSGILINNNSKIQIIGCKFTKCNGPALELSDGCGVFSKNNIFEQNGNPSTILINSCSSIESLSDSILSSNSNGIILSGNSNSNFSKLQLKNINGFGIYSFENSFLNISSSIISNIFGTAIYSNSNNIKILETKIFSISEFGLILNSLNNGIFSKLKIEDCNFSGIEISKQNNELIFEKCSIINNHECGLILIDSKIDLKLSEISNNYFCAIDSNNSNLKLNQCSISLNIHGGLYIKENSNLIIENSLIKENNDIAFSIESKSKANIDKCDISNNKNIAFGIVRQSNVNILNAKICNNELAFQIEGRATKINIDKCEISDNLYGLLSSDNSNVFLKGGNFKNNSRHIELKLGSILKANTVTFSDSKGPVSINILNDSNAEIINCHIKDNNGIGISNSGILNISKSKLFKNNILGIYSYGNSNIQIIENVFTKNGDCGIYLSKGSGQIFNCKFENHLAIAILLNQFSNVELIDNIFDENGSMNINFE